MYEPLIIKLPGHFLIIKGTCSIPGNSTMEKNLAVQSKVSVNKK
jgi:hypothetical protein